MALSWSLWASHVVEANVLLSRGGGDTEVVRPKKRPNKESVWAAGFPLMVRNPIHSSSPGAIPSVGTKGPLENATCN